MESKMGPSLRDFEAQIDRDESARDLILHQARACSNTGHARLIFGHYLTAIHEGVLDGHPYLAACVARLAYVFARTNAGLLPPDATERALDLCRALDFVLSHVDRHPEACVQASRENKIHRLLISAHSRLLTKPDTVSRDELPAIFQRVRFHEVGV